ENKDNPPVIAVPSGNFGNICAGLLAHRSGLPVSQFIAACNANNTVPEYFRTGSYVPRPSVATMSNAMDVGDPSNFKRVLELFDHELPLLQEKLTAVSVSDQDTKQTVKHLLRQYNYLPDPHGAVAFRALADYLEEKKHERGIFLETAHPIKFYDRLEPVTGQEVPIPASISKILGKEKKSTRMKVSDSDLKDFLMSS
ncbi:MAG TPA: pyridoxal-phosphate dependent enzyme, partial [Chitinophagaceae bacterium]|nr:pyridoxal-phosphate dependent enzyme [Chitinophagaceae bacterium]